MGKPGWNKACQCGSIACALTLDFFESSMRFPGPHLRVKAGQAFAEMPQRVGVGFSPR